MTSVTSISRSWILSLPKRNMSLHKLQPLVDWQLYLIHPSISFMKDFLLEKVFFVKLDVSQVATILYYAMR